MLTCGHDQFHTRCIEKYLTNNKSCCISCHLVVETAGVVQMDVNWWFVLNNLFNKLVLIGTWGILVLIGTWCILVLIGTLCILVLIGTFTN